MTARIAPLGAFTGKQLSQWKRYEKVRASGRFNMFDPRARRATRLSADAYTFVMTHWKALKVAQA